MRNKLHILHLDDSAVIIARVNKILDPLENIQAIETANTILQAKEILDTRKIDVAILDMHLPDGNGITLLKWIKRNHPSIIVIIFSNHSDSFFRNAAAKAGAEYFLDKSTEFEQIPKIISEISKKSLKNKNNENLIIYFQHCGSVRLGAEQQDSAKERNYNCCKLRLH
jgi:DNA-binding NarL/FixJ family response regulator